MTIFNFGFLNPFANNAPSNEIEAFPDENRGLGIAFDETEGKPEMKGLNGLFNKITQSLLSIKQNGLIGWTNDIEYIAGGFTIDSGKLYQAIRNNINKKPSLSQSDWALWLPVSNILVSTNGNLKKTSDASGGITLEVPTASDIQRGAVRAATSTEVVNKSNVNAYVNPANVKDMFLADSQSITLPNGSVLKFGIINLGRDETRTMFFAKPFPNNIYSVQLTDMQTATGIIENMSILYGSPTRLSFSLINRWVGDSEGSKVAITTHWFAIGD